jgi:homogentisate phytyltransferase / homogentisate geranylgeranyltransferase
MQYALIGSGLLGLLYSLPPIRLKRFPVFACFCHASRSFLLTLGTFFQAKTQILGIAIPDAESALSFYPESIFLATFYSIFSLVLALMKDIPDIKGDSEHNIFTFSVQYGPNQMLR